MVDQYDGGALLGCNRRRVSDRLDVLATVELRIAPARLTNEIAAFVDECWRPAFARYLYPRYTGLRRELHHYLADYNFDRVHHGRLTNGRIPADIVYGASKVKAR